MSIEIRRMPADDDELYEFVKTLWDIELPRIQVCSNHCSPFQAFADAYFARSAVAVWKASRGFGGKSFLLGTLAITEAVTLGAEVTVLGGSASQSLRVHDVTQEAWYAPLAPSNMLSKDPTKFDTYLANRGHVRALMASQRSVRGPHPQRLRLDEIDEMEMDILEASLGQPMSARGIQTHTVMSSTHQYPDKTMSAILERAEENKWPVFEWCYKETLEPNGWLTKSDVSRKRQEVTQAMWKIEYDLQEPSFEGRALSADTLENLFDKTKGQHIGQIGEYIEIEPPEKEPEPEPYAKGNRELWVPPLYVTGVDWAKEHDMTVIATFRADTTPWRLVAFERMNRLPWPVMAKRLDLRLDRYGGVCAHDATGIGNVVNDYVEHEVVPIVLSNRTRQEYTAEYVSAIENRRIKCPMVEWAYNDHKYATLEDLYGKGHTPDSVVAFALAWILRDDNQEIPPPVVDELAGESAWSFM